MDENRARRVADALRDRGIDAHLETAGIDVYGVRVVLSGGREAIWGNEGTSSLEAEVLLDEEDPDYPLTAIIYEQSSFGDGSFANVPALQELPDPMTSVMWGSWVEINPKTASSLGISDGNIVDVQTPTGSVRLPALLYPGIRPDLLARSRDRLATPGPDSGEMNLIHEDLSADRSTV